MTDEIRRSDVQDTQRLDEIRHAEFGGILPRAPLSWESDRKFLLRLIDALTVERDALRAAVVMILTEYEHGHNRIDEAKADRLAALLEKTDGPVGPVTP